MDCVPDIATQQEIYQQVLDSELFYKAVLSQDEPHPLPDRLTADEDILACFDEIRVLKSQLTSLKAYANFVSEVLTDKPVDQLSTPKEAAIADNVLSKEKQNLRSIKRERAAVDSRLPATIEELFIAARKQDQQMSRLRNQLLRSKASIRAKEVDAAIASGNAKVLESLVDVIDEVDKESCEKIIDFMRQVTTTNERDGSQLSSEVDALRSQLMQRRISLEQLQKKKEELERRKEHIAHTVPGALQAHAKGAFEEQLSKVLFAFGGVRVKYMRENGIQIAIDSTIFGSDAARHRRGSEYSKTTHMLDIEFDTEDSSESVVMRGLRVRGIDLTPPDVPVSDLKQVPLKWAVHEVNSRLCKFVKSAIGDRNEIE